MYNNTGSFLLIAITSPKPIANEHRLILELLANGFDFVHIRKPTSTYEELRTYLLPFIQAGVGSKLILHSHYSLLSQFELGGIHLTESAKKNTALYSLPYLHSLAIHNLAELSSPTLSQFAYSIVSPIFASISKEGYIPPFSLSQFREAVKTSTSPVVALGGITLKHIPQLRSMGCQGAAFLGYLWQVNYSHKLAQIAKHLREKANE